VIHGCVKEPGQGPCASVGPKSFLWGISVFSYVRFYVVQRRLHVLFHGLFKSLFFWVWSLAELWYYSLLLHPKVNKRKQWGQAEYALEKEQMKTSSMILPGWSVSSYLNTSSCRLCMNSDLNWNEQFWVLWKIFAEVSNWSRIAR
jgi:hypothetical protein